ncbi:hypothetical protein FKM82_011034 [Ascaphus truei]
MCLRAVNGLPYVTAHVRDVITSRRVRQGALSLVMGTSEAESVYGQFTAHARLCVWYIRVLGRLNKPCITSRACAPLHSGLKCNEQSKEHTYPLTMIAKRPQI